MLQNATPLRKSAPWPPNNLLSNVSCTAPATETASLQILLKCPTPANAFANATKTITFCSLWAKCRIPCGACHAKRHLNLQKWSEHLVFLTFWLGNVLRATTAYTLWISQLQKCSTTLTCFVTFWHRNVLRASSRHNGVHFFDMSTSKSGPMLVRFVHFDFKMRFAPQRRAIFNLSSGQMAPHPPLQRAYFSTLLSHKPLEKHSVSRLSYLFAHLHLLSSDSFSSLIFSLLITLLFSDSSHLCFSICPYCRKFDF